MQMLRYNSELGSELGRRVSSCKSWADLVAACGAQEEAQSAAATVLEQARRAGTDAALAAARDGSWQVGMTMKQRRKAAAGGGGGGSGGGDGKAYSDEYFARMAREDAKGGGVAVGAKRKADGAAGGAEKRVKA